MTENIKCEFKITAEHLKLVSGAIKAARKYEQSLGRKLGITGEVGEVLACHELGLYLCKDSLSKGYDAVDKNGKKIQIKTRRSEKLDVPTDRARIGKIRHKCDYVLMVILARDYSVKEIWKAQYKKLQPFLAKQKGSGIPIGSFKKAAERIR